MNDEAYQDLRNLNWFFHSPGLLRPSAFTPEEKLVSDREIASFPKLNPTLMSELSDDPRAFSEFLQKAKQTRRLGRYNEAMAEFAILNFLKPSRYQSNLPIRIGKRTVGELDVLFDALNAPAQHWELSVKFYLSTARDAVSRKQTQFFMGTIVEDRLDRKLKHLFENQLPLVDRAEAKAELQRHGWETAFQSRVLMKGLFFYPTEDALSELPDEISPAHERGWWTTSKEMKIPQKVTGSRYVRLFPLEWMASFGRTIPAEKLMTREQLEDFVRQYFLGEVTPEWVRRRELTFAEVEILAESAEGITVREISRGHFVHEEWPELAKWAAEQPLESLS